MYILNFVIYLYKRENRVKQNWLKAEMQVVEGFSEENSSGLIQIFIT